MGETIGRQTEGSVCVDPNAAEWHETGTPGVWMKTIFRDEATGEHTSLMKMEPGSYGAAHAHDQLEEIFVLEGSFYDDERTYGPGQYCQRAIGAVHAAGSHSGCVMLLVYRA